MNKTTCIIAMSVLALSACAGRTGNPVMVSQYGDQNKSCKALETEMIGIQSEIQHLLPKTDKSGKNIALGVAGAFILVPWFFMDFKNGDEVEYEAYRQRYNYLAVIAAQKDCNVEAAQLPSSEEIKTQYKKKNGQLNN